jgi:hypothetical protein
MTTTIETTQNVHPLSVPELAVIASVIIGQMDQRWSTHQAVRVDLSHIRDRHTPLIHLDIDNYSTTPEERAAWLADLARSLGEPVPEPSQTTGIAGLYHRDWQGTGITVAAQATVRAEADHTRQQQRKGER